MSGTLYVVATPIGNLEDITLRALRILKEVDAIACEDTRHTRTLLTHFAIGTRTISYHEHNEASRARELLDRLEGGDSIALVTDAGTPAISDPGYRLVAGAVERGIRVVPLPGASAVIAALSASGLPTDEFHFVGFLPAKQSARRARLAALAERADTLVFYEAPHRVARSLADMAEAFGDRSAVVAREITKLHEEFERGSLASLAESIAAKEPRGEYVILVTGRVEAEREHGDADALELVARLESEGVARMDAIKRAARELGLHKRDVYALVTAAGERAD